MTAAMLLISRQAGVLANHSARCLSPRASDCLLWGHMQPRLLVPVFLQRSLQLVFCIALDTCQSHKANSGPSIEFTHIPPMAQGGRERGDTISGRVRNAPPKQQIVMRTAGHGGCSPGRLTSDHDGGRWCPART